MSSSSTTTRTVVCPGKFNTDWMEVDYVKCRVNSKNERRIVAVLCAPKWHPIGEVGSGDEEEEGALRVAVDRQRVQFTFGGWRERGITATYFTGQMWYVDGNLATTRTRTCPCTGSLC